MRTQESEEMYLETIYRIGKDRTDVHAIDVAVELGYSKPSVSRAVGLLKKRGYISVDPTGALVLTDTGKAKAEGVRKDGAFLYQKIGDSYVKNRAFCFYAARR